MEKDAKVLAGITGVNPFKSQSKNYKKFNNNVRRSFICWLKDFTCEVCKFKNETKTFHFHHVDPKRKKGRVIPMATGKNRIKLFKEIFKCVYVCENCHYKIHAEEGGLNGQYEIINRWRHSYISDLLGGPNGGTMG
tara:strand:- start:287 stop:694 length:408 start_codon:yes stop_codon:yes gene_type:complete